MPTCNKYFCVLVLYNLKQNVDLDKGKIKNNLISKLYSNQEKP